MLIPSLIQHKRDGRTIAPEDWTRLIADYTAGKVPDYQMSALLMAVVFRGLASEELAALTDAMLASGDRLRFDGFPLPRVDKHSTGGVGDKVSLLLAPMVASCGVAVPMMSGRGPAVAGWASISQLAVVNACQMPFKLGLPSSERPPPAVCPWPGRAVNPRTATATSAETATNVLNPLRIPLLLARGRSEIELRAHPQQSCAQHLRGVLP